MSHNHFVKGRGSGIRTPMTSPLRPTLGGRSYYFLVDTFKVCLRGFSFWRSTSYLWRHMKFLGQKVRFWILSPTCSIIRSYFSIFATNSHEILRYTELSHLYTKTWNQYEHMHFAFLFMLWWCLSRYWTKFKPRPRSNFHPIHTFPFPKWWRFTANIE